MSPTSIGLIINLALGHDVYRRLEHRGIVARGSPFKPAASMVLERKAATLNRERCATSSQAIAPGAGSPQRELRFGRTAGLWCSESSTINPQRVSSSVWKRIARRSVDEQTI